MTKAQQLTIFTTKEAVVLMHFSFSETGYPGHPTHDISLNFTPIGEGLWPLRSKCYRHLKLYLTILFGLCLSLVMSVLPVQQKRSPSRKSLTVNSKRLINKVHDFLERFQTKYQTRRGTSIKTISQP